jgi:MoaA/NifB/PqqE/SkfB family radical SAM enzyme
MCGHWKRKDKKIIKVAPLIHFLEIGKELGLESVCYSGGDPFAYPTEELNHLMEWHLKNKIIYGFVAAGFVPFGINLELLRKSEFLSCSLDTVDDELYRRTRGGILTAALVKECIKDLVKEKIPIRISMVVHSANWEKVPAVFDFILENNIKEVRIHGVRAHSKMDLTSEQIEEFFTLINPYKRLFDYAGTIHNLDELQLTHTPCCQFDRCFTTLYQLFIDSDGKIYPCCTMGGDTQENVRLSPLGSIYGIDNSSDWILYNWPAILFYSKIPFNELPVICHSECKSRHAMINNQVGAEWDKKYFH